VVARAGVYLRADVDDSSAEILPELVSAVGDLEKPVELTFVDLHTRLATPPTTLEPLTAVVQDRLHQLVSGDLLLFRWPWLSGPEDETHIELIERWIHRLTDTTGGEPVVASTIKVGVIQHRVAAGPIVRWSGDSPEYEVTVLAHARSVELQALLRRSNAIWEPTAYHYRLPNGEHTDTFIRFADAIQSPQDAYVLACWLSDRLSNGVGIVADTGGLTSILIQLETFMAKFGLSVSGTAILEAYPAGRPMVRRTVESVATEFGSSIIGLQSVSSSGGLLRTFADEIERVAASFGLDYSLDVFIDRLGSPENCSTLSPNGEVRILSWVGLDESAKSGATGSCELCRDPDKAQFVAIDPRTYGEMALPAPHLVMPNTVYADAAHIFWERVANVQGVSIEANPHPSSRVARGKRIALPVRPMFELIVHVEGLTSDVAARARQLDSTRHLSTTGLVLASLHDVSTVKRPEFAGGGEINLENSTRALLAGLNLSPATPIVHDRDGDGLGAALAAMPADESVLVFSWGAVTGLTLRRMKLMVADQLRALGLERDVHGLVMHSRPSSPREWSALQNQFRPGLLLDLWTSCHPWDSPLRDEQRLLDRSGLAEADLSPSGSQFLGRRTAFLNLHATFEGEEDDWSPRFDLAPDGPDPRHVFWGMTSSGIHQQHVRGRSLYGKGLDCLSAYAAIGATVHFTRLDERPSAAPRWLMFDVGRLVRSYFDAVITCSAIRWLQPGELWWGAYNDDADSVRDSVAYLLDQAADGVEEQVLLVPELLLAAAQGKVPTGAHGVVIDRAESLSASWPDDPAFAEVRGAVEVGIALLRSR
jgi:hypothetical protein